MLAQIHAFNAIREVHRRSRRQGREREPCSFDSALRLNWTCLSSFRRTQSGMAEACPVVIKAKFDFQQVRITLRGISITTDGSDNVRLITHKNQQSFPVRVTLVTAAIGVPAFRKQGPSQLQSRLSRRRQQCRR